MKNFTIALNAVLLLAVGILYYLHFASPKKVVYTESQSATQNAAFKIAYFEIDSVQNNYEYFKQVIKELNTLEQQKRSELAAKQNAMQSKYKSYQDKGNTMTQTEIAQAQAELQDMDKDLQAAQQQKGQELDNERFKKLQAIKKKIEDYLAEYNKNKGYAYIFASSPDLIYYKDSVYNITGDLVKGLNDLYKNKK
jgi:outer membrane protein